MFEGKLLLFVNETALQEAVVQKIICGPDCSALISTQVLWTVMWFVPSVLCVVLVSKMI